MLPSIIKLRKNNVNPTNLIGDKGYTGKKYTKYIKTMYDINYIYPSKSNSKILNTDEEKQLINTRYINENGISWLFQHKRISVRNETFTDSYKAFIDIACANIIFRRLF